MRNSFLIAVGILFSTVTFAQTAPNVTDAAGKKQGHWIKLDEDKKKIYEGHFENNIPVGTFTYYYDTGTPWSISVFSKNGTVARAKMFDAGGKLTGEGKFINQKKDSVWKFYNQDGKLLSDEVYLNGLKNGPARVYYSNGQIAEEKVWKNDVLEGPCKKYFESGQLKYSGAYSKNKVEGKVTYYYASGKIDAEGMYVNDLKNGPWKYYKEDGTIIRTDTYQWGKMTETTDKNKNRDVITKEQQELEKKNSQQFELKDPHQDNYRGEY
jgi:antitoxin component YwqK of YwqJK toxin-antitoxin module